MKAASEIWPRHSLLGNRTDLVRASSFGPFAPLAPVGAPNPNHINRTQQEMRKNIQSLAKLPTTICFSLEFDSEKQMPRIVGLLGGIFCRIQDLDSAEAWDCLRNPSPQDHNFTVSDSLMAVTLVTTVSVYQILPNHIITSSLHHIASLHPFPWYEPPFRAGPIQSRGLSARILS